MPAFSKPVEKKLLRKLRKLGTPDGGKAELATKTGISRSTITDVLSSGKALPATIEKLKAAFNPQPVPPAQPAA